MCQLVHSIPHVHASFGSHIRVGPVCVGGGIDYCKVGLKSWASYGVMGVVGGLTAIIAFLHGMSAGSFQRSYFLQGLLVPRGGLK